MRTWICSVALLLAAPIGAAHGQTLDALNAERASHFIYLVAEPAPRVGKIVFSYAIDAHAGRDVRVPLASPITIASTRQRPLNVVLRYMNPVRYSWTVSEQTKDDPTKLAVGEFLKSATALFGMVDGVAATPASAGAAPSKASDKPLTVAAPIPPTSTSAAAPMTVLPDRLIKFETSALVKNDAGKLIPVKRNATIRVPVLYSPALRDWAMWIETRQECFTDAAATAGFLSSIESADHRLFGPLSSDTAGASTAESFKNSILGTLKSLSEASNIKELKEATIDASTALSKLANVNKNARFALDAVKPVSKWAEGPTCDNFAISTAAALEAFRSEGNKLMDTREKIVADLGVVNQSVSSLLLPSMAAEGDQEYFTIGNVIIPQGKMKDVTVVIHQTKVEIKDGVLLTTDLGDLTAQFNVMERQTLLFEFAPGVAYTNIHYPKFATSEVNGQNIVADAGSDTQNAAAVAMLNVTWNREWGSISRLIGQIGIGTGKQYPLLLVGGGIRLTDSSSYSFTVGAAFGWRQELSTLHVGSPVTGMADIEKDLKYSLNPRPQIYIGMQRGLQ